MNLNYKTSNIFNTCMRYSIELLLSIVLFSCADSKQSVINYEPSTYLTETESSELLKNLIPYSAKLPKGYDCTRKFDPALDSFYIQEIKKYKLEKYFFTEKDSSHYFLISREAPSLYEKRIAIVGKYQKNKSGNIVNYEEAFWTFKMKLPELAQKGEILFHEYVLGNDLSKYLPGKSDEEWIEFPDAHSQYNKTEQRWIFSAE
jgi:hypothetical protein